MTNKKKEHPACYGILGNVFPEGEEGLRFTPPSCFPCYFKTECLREAMKSVSGLKVREENIDRAYEAGMIGFMKRWSMKKSLQRRIGKKRK